MRRESELLDGSTQIFEKGIPGRSKVSGKKAYGNFEEVFTGSCLCGAKKFFEKEKCGLKGISVPESVES